LCGYLGKYNKEGSGRKKRKASKKSKSSAIEVTGEAAASRSVASKKVRMFISLLFHATNWYRRLGAGVDGATWESSDG